MKLLSGNATWQSDALKHYEMLLPDIKTNAEHSESN